LRTAQQTGAGGSGDIEQGERNMASVKDQLAELAKVEGITSAVVVSRDGFVIEGVSSNGDIDNEAVGAVISAGMGSSAVMGSELKVGSMSQMMVEYERGVIVVNFLGDEAVLATVADLRANLGNVRYQVKKRAPGIQAAL
jgi:predicted regulator of Ras-like GTPase activity (Roadblock/LC7/MglB family)